MTYGCLCVTTIDSLALFLTVEKRKLLAEFGYG